MRGEQRPPSGIEGEHLEAMRRAGATAIDVRYPRWLLDGRGEFYDAVRRPEFGPQVARYLDTLGPTYPKTLDELIARSKEFVGTRPDGATPNPPRWLLFERERASGAITDARYLAVRDHILPAVRALIDGTLQAHSLDAIVTLTRPQRPGLIATENAIGATSGRLSGPGSPSSLASMAGYPDLVVPAGFTSDPLPVTVSFLGPAFSEPRLLALGYAFEQATKTRRLPRHTPRLPGEAVSLP